MMAKNTRKPLYERLKKGLEEGIQFSKGELNLRTVEVPEKPPKATAKTIVALRGQTNLSQAVFAKLLNVSKKTVQSWEQGQRTPSQASLRLIQILNEQPNVVFKIVGLSDVLPTKVVKGKRLKKIARKNSKTVGKKKKKQKQTA